MNITINKKAENIEMKGNFFSQFKSTFESRVELGSYNDKSKSSFTGKSFKFDFSNGKAEMIEVGTGMKSATINISLDFEPKANVDIKMLEIDIKNFMQTQFEFSSNDYQLNMQSARRYTMS